MDNRADHCGLCKKSGLRSAYVPPDTQRGLKVYVCSGCGLIQSLPRIESVTNRVRAVSGGADWGNIRYGKAFRTAHDLEFIASHLELNRAGAVLDVGSSRGKFLSEVRAVNQSAELWGIEPDTTVADASNFDSSIKILPNRIQHVELPGNYFDFVYCSHTLEHLANPSHACGAIHRALKPGGVVFFEVPNVEWINGCDVIEEFFIDKHLYHFSPATFKRLLTASGFSLLRFKTTREYISVLAEKRSETLGERLVDQSSSDPTEWVESITDYINVMHRNRVRAAWASNRIHFLCERHEVVFWGAGRILDILIKHGKLNISKARAVVDKNLTRYVSMVAGISLQEPGTIAGLMSPIVIVFSREYYDEIRSEALSINPNIQSVDCVFDFFDITEDQLSPEKE